MSAKPLVLERPVLFLLGLNRFIFSFFPMKTDVTCFALNREATQFQNQHSKENINLSTFIYLNALYHRITINSKVSSRNAYCLLNSKSNLNCV